MTEHSEEFDCEFDAIIPEPMFTDEGFENPNFMPALNAAIDNIPEAYERLKNRPEWNTPRWTHYREIVGAIALWAVRQIDDAAEGAKPFPPNLEQVLGYVAACIRPQFDGDGVKVMDGYSKVSLCDINRMLHGILTEERFKPFMEWNTKECLGDAWLDLSAILLNVCNTIKHERERNDEFDRKFEEDWAKNPNNPENQNEAES